LNEVLDLPNQK
jgi:hypothetical protein